MKEHKARQRQQSKKERDEVYKQMTRNVEKVKAITRESLSRASTISVEENRMALSRADFKNIQGTMDKIDQKIRGFISKLASRV